ncbi:MAG TPA: divergent polysaccharide deacetylase family protein [Sulfuricurvum sp.]|nr:divergent polysaccharide deacetylase family protein [Sulfuricurvum sp.]
MDKPPFSFRTLLSVKKIILYLSLLIVVLIAILIGYFIGFNQVQEELDQEREQTHLLMKQIKEIAKVDTESLSLDATASKKQDYEIQRLKKELKELLDRERINAQHEYAPKDKKAAPPPADKRVSRPSATGAKLVIIMDDVSYEHDVKAIRSIGLPLVMSFLPPNSRHPESATLAASVPGYMVHLPLEAVDYNGEEPITLRTTDPLESIIKQITTIKRLYPNVRYINNHTGSKFTADEEAMDKLVQVTKANGLIFVDSRTTAKSKVKQINAKYGMRYLGRDVFLDHHNGVANIKKQIREAVAVAKRHGSAIAIGHPRADTIEALKQSKKILSEVQLVQIDQI